MPNPVKLYWLIKPVKLNNFGEKKILVTELKTTEVEYRKAQNICRQMFSR
jgi:hypothetical protein